MNRASGYTLIELLVVMAILGILATVAMPLAQMQVQRQREQELRRALWTLRDAIDAYRAASETGAIAGSPTRWPPSLAALTELHSDARASHAGQSMRFLRAVPRDPFADPSLPADRTWGLRSFDSEADRPRAGVDVYDVYSLASGMGLNGIPLRDW